MFLDGFKDEHFFTKNFGNYSIEVHLRSNAIGMPIENNDIENNFNIKVIDNIEFITDGSLIQNNSRIIFSYISDHWENIRIRLTGNSQCDLTR